MTSDSRVQSHPASVETYIRHGWSLVPIPPGTKGPAHKGWNLKENALTLDMTLPPGYGIGLAHAYSGTMALDIDNWDRAAFELMMRGIDLAALYAAPDAVIIDSGRQGHGKLLYAMPFGLALPSKRVVIDNTTIYELRCATGNGVTVQDILPPTIHPDTRQPYRWAGSGHWSRLPVIPQALLDLWQSLLATDTRAPQTVVQEGTEKVDWDEIVSALGAVAPDCSREEWITIGMACQCAGVLSGEPNRAFEVWDTWSKGSATKYPGPRDMATQWNSFRADKGNRVTLGSLFKLARDAGWSKPMPDASTFFSPLTVIKHPDQVIADIRIPPPDLDFDLVPAVLRTRAMEISEHIGCDPLVPLMAGMAAVCGALDARIRLELMPGFKVPPVLWICSIGEPGDKKTPGSKPMFEILTQLEREDAPRFAKAAVDFEVNEARYVVAKKHLIDSATAPEALLTNSPLPTLPPNPAKPVPLKITVQDISSQKLVRHAADRPRGLLCALDEMASWVEKVCDPRSGDDRSAWTVAYESGRYEMDRVGTGTTLADNYAVAFFGNLQPRVLRENFKALSKDGLVQRFIPVNIRPEMRKLGHPVPEYMTNSAEYDQAIRVCFGLPPMTYRLSGSAYDTYREFQRWYERAMQDERILKGSETVQTALGKMEGLVGRIALVWHCIEAPYSLEVSEPLMRRAVEFVTRFVIPSLRYTFDGDYGGAVGLEKWCAEYVLQYADEPSFTLGQLKRSARRQIENMTSMVAQQQLLIAMAPLEDAKWVARMDDGTQEFKGIATWAINPGLKEWFKDYRDQVTAAKQRRRDELHQGPKTERTRVPGYTGPREPALEKRVA